jgi:hypothetical protein
MKTPAAGGRHGHIFKKAYSGNGQTSDMREAFAYISPSAIQALYSITLYFLRV